MLDGLLGRGFSSKCKSSIKLTRTRIDVIRRNKDARQRIMKKDIADLLSNGLDINAFGRTEELSAGLNLLLCYDFIDQSCEYILKQLSIMQKQRECPEECRETVASLMFAAARFSDLPELRDLRDTFQERYGSSLECFVNQKFFEKLAPKPPTMEKKIQLLQEIASEFSIKWDSRGFQKRMATPSAFTKDQPAKYWPIHVTDDKYKLPNGKDNVQQPSKRDVSSKERSELVHDRHRMRDNIGDNVLKREGLDAQFLGKHELTDNRHKPLANKEESMPNRELTTDKRHASSGKEETTLKTRRSGSSSRGKRPEFTDGGYKLHNDGANIVPRRRHDPLSDGKPEVSESCAGDLFKSEGKDLSHGGYNRCEKQTTKSSTRKYHKEESEGKNSYFHNALPPPYTKSKDNMIPTPYTKSKERKHGTRSERDRASSDPSIHDKANGVVNLSETTDVEPEHPNYDRHVMGPTRVNSHGHEKDSLSIDNIPLPKPRSVRRKHSKSSSSRDDHGNFENAGFVKKSSSSRRESSRKGLQILFEDEHGRKDEEEKMIDKLLLHYSKKETTYEPGMLRRKSKAQIASDSASGSSQVKSRDEADAELDMSKLRSVSLPSEQASISEGKKVFARANSFQPDNQARHVHPKLPDYDDLAARFASLRGR